MSADTGAGDSFPTIQLEVRLDMTIPAKKPETLPDLLRTLERSGDLRSLARECGLSVRELRRRLAIWRRELRVDDDPAEAGAEPAVAAGKGSTSGAPARKKVDSDGRWPELVAAEELEENPLPDSGEGILEIFTDGASRGNPGPAAVGIVFHKKNGPALCEHSEAIGKATNNVAEYRAIVTALEHCKRWNARRVHVFMDSELIVRQIKGAYRVKSPDLRPLYQQVIFLTRAMKDFRVTHIPRAKNAHADALANRALDAD